MNIQKLIINIATVFALGMSYAPAAIVTYDRAGFDTAAAGGSTVIQNFDGIAAGTTVGTVNGVTYSASLGTPIITNGYVATTGSNSLASTSAGFFESNESATFTFANPIYAFGIDINTYGTSSGDYLGATTNLGNVALSVFDPFPGDSTGQFIGFSSTIGFTTVTLSTLPDSSNNRYTYTLDTLRYGSLDAASAPEPASLAALGLGLALVGAIARKRARQ